MLFPRTVFASENTINQQITHVCSELVEVVDESLKPTVNHFLLAMELNDLIHSAETALHILAEQHGVNNERAFTAVLKKNTERNYYR